MHDPIGPLFPKRRTRWVCCVNGVRACTVAPNAQNKDRPYLGILRTPLLPVCQAVTISAVMRRAITLYGRRHCRDVRTAVAGAGPHMNVRYIKIDRICGAAANAACAKDDPRAIEEVGIVYSPI